MGEFPVPEEALSPTAGVARAPLIAVSSDGRISANVQNRPLEEMLRLMSEKNLFEIQSSLPTGALVTMQFSGLTLEQTLYKMMRGYNYAVIKEDVSDKRVLIVLGEAKRIEYKESAKPTQTLKQSEGMPEQAISKAPDARTANLPGPAPLRARMNAANPASPLGPPQAAEAPPIPAQEQKSPEQSDVGRLLTVSGAAGIPPKPENGSAVQEQRPPDRPTLGSF
jgi:hypothetical protein